MARRGRRWAGRPEPARSYVAVGYCTFHAKQCFRTRGDARQRSDQFHDKHRSVYRCWETNFWHTGTLADPVISGEVTRDEIYREVA